MAMATIVSFTGINKEMIYVLGVFIGIDIITALLREVRLETGRIKSKSFWFGVGAKGLVILIPLMVSLAGKGVGIDLKWLAEISIATLILAEFYSSLGNIMQTIKGNDAIDEQDAITMIIKTLESYIKKLLISLLEPINKKQDGKQ